MIDAAELPLGGWCAPGYEPVRDAFVRNFIDGGEVGAAVHVIRRGEVVVDLVGGWADEARTRPWSTETIVDVYSVGKGLLSMLVLQLVDSGELRLEDTVASVWPEFGAGGKDTATIEHALTHRAGVPAIRELLTDEDLFDWERMTSALAATDAWWIPGERLAYHVNTFGHLNGELLHRVTGQMPGDRLRGVAEPLGADVWFGVPDQEQHRCAEVIWAPSAPIPQVRSYEGLEGDVLMNLLAHVNPPGYSSIGVVNTAKWRAAQIGSTSDHASASGIARLYGAMLEPGLLLSQRLLEEATSVRTSGHCPILGQEVAFGLGFQPTTPARPLGPNPRSFGHYGTGGALGFADPDAEIAFGYAMNHAIPRWQSTRNRSLIDALYQVVTPG